MNSSALVKKTILCKRCIILWLTVLFEIFIVLKYKNFAVDLHFNNIYESMLLLFKFSVIIIQYLSFLLLGYLCVVIFLKTYKVLKMTIITIVLYFIAIFILQDLFSYFVLEAGIKSDKVINMFRNIGSLYIIAAIHYIHSNSKVVDIYERD